MSAQPRTLSAADQAAIAAFKGQVTVVEANVSVGLSKKKYGLAKPRGFAGRPAAEKIASGDPKFDMYCNALPGFMRQWAAATEQDVRALYKEYRDLKADGMSAKYQPIVQAWEQNNV